MRRIKKLISPIETFLKLEASGGIILMIAATLSFVFANSALSDTYDKIVNLPITFGAGTAAITHSLVFWVNDGLMVIFFFVVGLEIKRELISGELNTKAKAAFPSIAALGGAVVPAIVYYYFTKHSATMVHGWGIPMATDIAFAVGVLSLFGKRVPTSLKIFLLALAIVDDLIAVLVIALFYTAHINLGALIAAGVIFLITHWVKQARVASFTPYIFLGIFAWLAIFASGVHATVAGVILGLMTPLSLPDKQVQPIQTLVHFLHPWVAFFIMPVFAFLNAGVHFKFNELSAAFQHPITLGIAVGLIFGKPVGIFLSTYIASKLKIVTIPSDINYKHIFAIGTLAGIGFTMSLFIAGLSFENPAYIDAGKIGIMVASVLAAIGGSVILHFALKQKA